MNMTTKNLLVELFVEELPPKALHRLGKSFAQDMWLKLAHDSLVDNSQTYGETYIAYASPRRLAVWIKDVLSQAPDRQERQKLMPVAVGLDTNGQPTPALLKKLSSLGVGAEVVPQLRREGEGKAESLVYDSMKSGTTLAEGLQQAVQETLANLPIPKVMCYQLADGWSTVNFVRPAHRLVALHGSEIVPVSVLGLQAGRTTQGHRFEAQNATLEVRDADSYEAQMENEGAVIPSFEKRRTEIVKQLAAAAAHEHLTPIADEALLDEVTALVERPNVLVGKFEKEYLEVPQECLILTMKANQKYFPLLDANGKLTNKFLIVSNIRPADASLVIGGNERVVRPRLADAKFFFDKDRKKTLASRVDGLSKVVYHNKLGSQGERVERVRAIAKAIGQQLGDDALAAQADQAAMLAKADLPTDMVGEFPELQGIMGRYYAQHDGLSDDIAFAIEDHYKPRFAGDELPRNMVGICVALADKLETLVGMFGIGQIPTGDKDPFALRRHALGVIRLLLERGLSVSVGSLLNSAIDEGFGDRFNEDVQFQIFTSVFTFVMDRLVGALQEQGFTLPQVLSIQRDASIVLTDVPKRLEAVRAFTAMPEAAALAAANKRVGNILKKAESDPALRQAQGERFEIDVSRQEHAEMALHQALSQIAPKADKAFATGNYTASLQALAALRTPVDAFFDNVMVNVEDAALRANRLALLLQLQQAMNRVADISKLAT